MPLYFPPILLFACNLTAACCCINRTCHQNSCYTSWCTQRFACDSWFCTAFFCCCFCYIQIKIIKFCHCLFLLLSYLPVIWQPHVAVLIAHVIKIPVTHPGVHRDLLVILGSALLSFAVVLITSRSKSSNLAITFSSFPINISCKKTFLLENVLPKEIFLQFFLTPIVILCKNQKNIKNIKKSKIYIYYSNSIKKDSHIFVTVLFFSNNTYCLNTRHFYTHFSPMRFS